MFRSARGSVRPTPQRSSASTYSSFQELTNNAKRKRAHSESDEDKSSSSDDIIVDKVEIRSHKKKKEKKRKKDKKHKSKKKHRRSSSPDQIPSTSATVSISSEDPFVEDRQRLASRYNYKFEKTLKKHSIKCDTNLPLTLNRDGMALKSLFYPEKEKTILRYYSWEVREPFLKVASERVFRKFTKGPFLTEDGMSVSQTPCNPFEEANHTYHDDFVSTNEFDEDVSSKERKFEDFESLTIKQRKRRIQKDIDFDQSNLEAWMKFLKLEDEEFESIKNASKSSAAAIRTSFLERRLEIIKRSLEKVPKASSLKLHLEWIYSATELYGYFDSRILKQWEKLQNIYINSLDLWNAYIQQLLHNSSNFNLTNVLKKMDHAIERLSLIFAGILVSHESSTGTDEFLIELVVNRARLLMESGHVYTVVAIVQAVAEFYFFSPDNVRNMIWPNRLKAFERFWASNIPRLGDENGKGWKNDADETKDMTEQYLQSENRLAKHCYDLETLLVESLQAMDDTNRLIAWSELETIRSNVFWKPLVCLQAFVDEDIFECKKRMVDFSALKSSLLPFTDTKRPLKLMLRLLQVLGAVVSGLDDNSHFGFLHSILPNDFNFLRPVYTGLSDFIVNLMYSLCSSDQIVQKEEILVSIIYTRLSALDAEYADSSKKMVALNEIQTFTNKLNISPKSKYCVSVHIYDAILSCLVSRENTLGFDFPGDYKFPRLFENENFHPVEMKVLANILKNLEAGDPCLTNDEQHRQILLWSAYILTSFLPSSHFGSQINRMRFLTFLVLGQLKDFKNTNVILSSEMVEKAYAIWSDHMQSVLTKASTSTEYSFMETSDNLIFMLHSLFKFEHIKSPLFTNMDELTNRFIESSRSLTLFHLNVSFELFRFHQTDWISYSKWTLDAVKKYPEFSSIYRHLSNVFETTPCRLRSFVEWKMMDPKVKRLQAFAMFAAEYRKFEREREADDYLMSDQTFKRIRRVFEESAALISNSIVPDSFIWRLWYYIERHNRRTITEMDKVYLLGMAACPFSKQLFIDVTKSPLTPASRLEEIQSLTDGFELNMYALPSEADALVELAIKNQIVK